MNLEQRTRNAQTLSMVEADIQTVYRLLFRSFGPDDNKVRRLQQAMDLIEGVKNSLSGGTN